MSKKIMIVASDTDSKTEKEHTAAKTNLINIISTILFLAIAGAAIYFLAKPVWEVVKFITLAINLILAIFYTIILLMVSKKTSKSEVEKNQTLRDSMHSRHNAKPVSECSEKEKEAVIEKEKVFHGFLNLTGASMWFMPLFFGAMDRFQFVPLNYFAPVATILGLITWFKWFIGENSKNLNKLDEKLSKPSTGKIIFLKFTGVILTLYIGMVLITIITNFFGITLPTIPVVLR